MMTRQQRNMLQRPHNVRGWTLSHPSCLLRAVILQRRRSRLSPAMQRHPSHAGSTYTPTASPARPQQNSHASSPRQPQLNSATSTQPPQTQPPQLSAAPAHTPGRLSKGHRRPACRANHHATAHTPGRLVRGHRRPTCSANNQATAHTCRRSHPQPPAPPPRPPRGYRPSTNSEHTRCPSHTHISCTLLLSAASRAYCT